MEKAEFEPLLDVSRLVWRAWRGQLATGIDRTCLAYVRHYRRRARAVAQHRNFTLVLPSALSQSLFEILLQPGPNSKIRLAALLARSLIFRRRSNLSGQVYLNVGHTGLDKPGHRQWISQTGVLPFYFVHDLIPLTHPEYCRPEERAKHVRRMTALLTLGKGIIANSGHTLNELAMFAGSQRTLNMPTAVVAPLGVGKVEPGQEDAPIVPNLGRPYFVLLGTIEGRKNHLLILNIWADLARRLGASCPQLVVIGQRGWECEQAVDMLDRCGALRGHVIELSRCDDALLAALMAGARALLFPSFVEGYGLPLVEALSLGTPVLASDLKVFRELADDVPEYLSPLDGMGWMQLIENYAQPESALRADQLTRMENWQPPRWKQHFAKVDQWLEQFASASSGS